MRRTESCITSLKGEMKTTKALGKQGGNEGGRHGGYEGHGGIKAWQVRDSGDTAGPFSCTYIELPW